MRNIKCGNSEIHKKSVNRVGRCIQCDLINIEKMVDDETIDYDTEKTILDQLKNENSDLVN